MPSLGSDEVLVKVGACGINNTDVWVREGAYGTSEDPEAVASFGDSPLQFPLIQGADIAGDIAAVGDAVDPAPIGERVMVDFGIYNDDADDVPSDDYIGAGRPGGFAEYVAVPAANAHAVDTKLSDAELATFCCAYVTGERMLNRAAVAPGDHVLVTGASGGVGSGVLQLCRARGAVPYAVVGPGKESAVKAVGAEATVTRGTGSLMELVSAATGGKAIDVVVDTVAGAMLPELLEILRPHGRYVTCGAIGGPMVEIDMRRVYLRHLQIHGSSQGTRAGAIMRSRVRSSRSWQRPPLAEIAQAQEHFKRKNFVGKLVVVMH